jgi:hypothetical protein
MIIDFGSLGSLPSGYYEIEEQTKYAECTDSSPAFLRGILMLQADFNALSPAQRNEIGFMFPRWVLYGGPLLSRAVAKQWNDFMFFWAASNQRIWLPPGYDTPTPCIVRSPNLAWPTNQSFQWRWVREIEKPRRVARVITAPCTPACKYVWA